MVRFRLGFLLLTACLACDSDPEEPPDATMTGTLQRGDFVYVCAGSNDPVCESFVAQRFPDVMAVGGAFTVRFEPRDTSLAVPLVETPAPDLLERRGSTFVFQRPGDAALLALTQEDSSILDYLHVPAERVRSFTLRADDSPLGLADLTIEVGSEVDVSAEPRGEFGQVLAGTLLYDWTIDDETIARVRTDRTERSVRIEANQIGATRLFVEAGGLSSSIEVFVVEVDDTTTTDTDTDSGTDTDTDSGTDTDTDSGTDTDTDSGTDTDTDSGTDTGSSSGSTGGKR